MPSAFNFSASPFDCLSPDQQQLVQASVDVARFAKGQAVLEPGVQPTHLFIITQGFVQQFDGDELSATSVGLDGSFPASISGWKNGSGLRASTELEIRALSVRSSQ